MEMRDGGTHLDSRGLRRLLKIRSHLLAFAFLVCAAAAASSYAESAPVPINLQVPILFKILSLDKNLTRRAGEQITVGVLYDSRDKQSARERSEFKDAIGEGKKLAGKDLTVREYDMASSGNLADFASKNSISIIYATTGTEKAADEIIKVARDQKITTSTSNLALVEKGLSVSFEVDDNKPRIVINHEASKEEGCSFSAQVLKVARIVK